MVVIDSKNKYCKYSINTEVVSMLQDICTGSITSFEVRISRLANVNVDVARKMIWSEHNVAFISLYRRSSMPQYLMLAIKKLIEIIKNAKELNEKEHLKFLLQEINNNDYNNTIEGMIYIINMINTFLQGYTKEVVF